jgi:hypothetical protein
MTTTTTIAPLANVNSFKNYPIPFVVQVGTEYMRVTHAPDYPTFGTTTGSLTVVRGVLSTGADNGSPHVPTGNTIHAIGDALTVVPTALYPLAPSFSVSSAGDSLVENLLIDGAELRAPLWLTQVMSATYDEPGSINQHTVNYGGGGGVQPELFIIPPYVAAYGNTAPIIYMTSRSGQGPFITPGDDWPFRSKITLSAEEVHTDGVISADGMTVQGVGQNATFTLSSTTYAAGSTLCESGFFAPPSGRVVVSVGGECAGCNISFEIRNINVSGTVVYAADDIRCFGNNTTTLGRGSYSVLIGLLVPGNEYYIRTMHRQISGGTGSLQYRRLVIAPSL